MTRNLKTARMTTGGAFARRQLAPHNVINIMLVDNAREVHFQEVHAEVVHIEEEVEEEIEEDEEVLEEQGDAPAGAQSKHGFNASPQVVPLQVVSPTTDPPQAIQKEEAPAQSRDGWRSSICFRKMCDSYYYSLLLG